MDGILCKKCGNKTDSEDKKVFVTAYPFKDGDWFALLCRECFHSIRKAKEERDSRASFYLFFPVAEYSVDVWKIKKMLNFRKIGS